MVDSGPPLHNSQVEQDQPSDDLSGDDNDSMAPIVFDDDDHTMEDVEEDGLSLFPGGLAPPGQRRRQLLDMMRAWSEEMVAEMTDRVLSEGAVTSLAMMIERNFDEMRSAAKREKEKVSAPRKRAQRIVAPLENIFQQNKKRARTR